MSSKVLILGGTGAMGVYLRDILAERGHNVFVTSRTRRENTGRIHYCEGDAHDLSFLKRVVAEAKPDAIVDFMIYYTEAFRRRVRTVLGMSAQYIFISSYRVFAEEVPLSEKSPRLLDVVEDEAYLKTDEYALTKARQEDALRMSGRTNWTIVRPAITYSKARFQFGVLEKEVFVWRALRNLPVIMPAEMLDKQTTLTWGGDVARMIAGLVGNPLAMGEDFNCATAEHHSWREVADIYKKLIGLEVIPCAMEDYIFGANKYQISYDRMLNRVVDNSKILSATRMTQYSLMSLESGLSRELSTFCSHPSFKWFSLRRNADFDRITHTHTPLKDLERQDRWRYLKLRYPWIDRNLAVRALRKIRRSFRI